MKQHLCQCMIIGLTLLSVFISTNPLFCQMVPDSVKAIYQNEELPAEARLEALINYTNTNIMRLVPDSVLVLAEQSQQLAERENLPSYIVKALWQKSIALINKGVLDEAEAAANESLQLAQQHDIEMMIPRIYNAFGIIYNIKEDYVQSIDFYTKALKIQERLQETGKDTTGTGAILSNIGSIYGKQGDHLQARKYFELALTDLRSHGDKRNIANTLSGLAGTYYSLQDTSNNEKILTYLEEAGRLHQETGSLPNGAQVLREIGNIYALRGNFKLAGEKFDQALDLAKKTGNLWLISFILQRKAGNLADLGEHEQSIKLHEQALAMAEQGGYQQIIKEVSWTISNLYRKTGEWKKALEYYEQYINLKDSLVNEENQRALLRNEYQYNYDKQLLADSLAFAQQQAIKDLEIQQQKSTLFLQRLALISTIIGLLLLIALAYSIYRSRKQTQLEAERLQELDYFKTRLYTNITHEFRTPLTVISGMASQIGRQPKKYLQEGLKLILRNSNNLQRLINQLLDLSRLESNAFNLNIQQSDLVPYLNYLTESFQSYANSKNLAMHFSSTERSLLMDFDPEQIKQIMTNLISNALKFTPSGGSISVYLSRKEAHAQIEVEDTGMGIPEKDLPHIFDRFYQADHEAAQRGQGTGIGLSHTYELVKLMGGKIEVNSQVEGKSGTQFVISLPIQNEAPIQDVPMKQTPTIEREGEVSALSASSTSVDDADKRKVLIVEDNPDVVVYLKSCLEDRYQLDIALNGNIGVEKALEEVPDLIISDVMMPGKDGFEVCEQLKEDGRTSHVPIILLTAKADIPSKIQGYQYGADDYIAKPFHQEELLARIEQLIANRQKLKAYYSHHLEAFPPDDAVSNHQEMEKETAFIQNIRDILEASISDEDFGLPQLCQKVGMSRSQLFRKMKALTDTAPSEFIKNYRLKKAKYLLETTDKNVSQVAYEVGFKDPSYFSKIYQELFGAPPSATSM